MFRPSGAALIIQVTKVVIILRGGETVTDCGLYFEVVLVTVYWLEQQQLVVVSSRLNRERFVLYSNYLD